VHRVPHFIGRNAHHAFPVAISQERAFARRAADEDRVDAFGDEAANRRAVGRRVDSILVVTGVITGTTTPPSSLLHIIY
jgi:hypothetical protein